MKISELIVKLADNELPETERDELEKKLYQDPKLMQEYLTYLEMNKLLDEKFADKEVEEGTYSVDDKQENASQESLEAEKEAFKTGTFHSTIDLVKEIKQSKKKEYAHDLKEFVALGIKEMKEKAIGEEEKPVTITAKPQKSRFIKNWYFIAASIALFIIISVLVLESPFSKTDYSKLYTSYYQPYFFVVDQTRSSDPVLDSLVNEATVLYKFEKYREALEASSNALEINNKHVKAMFIRGLAMLETKNYTEAADEFETILKGYDSYQLESKWYLTLCFLQLDKPGEAKKLLRELELSKNLYQKRAKELLQKLGN